MNLIRVSALAQNWYYTFGPKEALRLIYLCNVSSHKKSLLRGLLYFSLDHCRCTAKYNIYVTRNGTRTLVKGYCNNWSRALSPYCYLHGGTEASKCPGARKSKKGDFYFTRDPTVCMEPKQRPNGELEKFFLKYLYIMQRDLQRLRWCKQNILHKFSETTFRTLYHVSNKTNNIWWF